MPTDVSGNRMFSLELPATLYERLAAKARIERRSMGFVTREALSSYLGASETTHNMGESSKTDSGKGSLQ